MVVGWWVQLLILLAISEAIDLVGSRSHAAHKFLVIELRSDLLAAILSSLLPLWRLQRRLSRSLSLLLGKAANKLLLLVAGNILLQHRVDLLHEILLLGSVASGHGVSAVVHAAACAGYCRLLLLFAFDVFLDNLTQLLLLWVLLVLKLLLLGPDCCLHFVEVYYGWLL